MFGTGEPKPTAVGEQDVALFEEAVGKVDTSSLCQYLSAVVGARNRFSAHDKMVEVENYIFDVLKKCGWTVEKQRYFHETFDGYSGTKDFARKHHKNLEGVNIIAKKLGKKPNRIILIGAHYDTVDGSPGADDNGTGIAALLELARILGKKSYSKTLVLVAFDMEETGFAGSRAFVERLPPTASVEGAIVLETVGFVSKEENSQRIPSGFSRLYREQTEKVKKRRFRGDFITVIHNGKSKKLASLLAGVNTSLNEAVPFVFIRDPLDLPVLGAILRRLLPALKNLLRSDHVPFWQAEIPAIQLTDTADFRNPNYHRPSDTLNTISLPFLQRLVQVVAATVIILAEK